MLVKRMANSEPRLCGQMKYHGLNLDLMREHKCEWETCGVVFQGPPNALYCPEHRNIASIMAKREYRKKLKRRAA